MTIDIIGFQEERAVDKSHQDENAAKIAVLENLGYSCGHYGHENRWCKRNGYISRSIKDK